MSGLWINYNAEAKHCPDPGLLQFTHFRALLFFAFFIFFAILVR
jgi:hypothetical protein